MIIISFTKRQDKMETKAMFVLLQLVNVVISDSHTGCPSLFLYSDLVQVSDQVGKMGAKYSKDITSLSFTVSSLTAHVLNTSSSSNCGNIFNNIGMLLNKGKLSCLPLLNLITT